MNKSARWHGLGGIHFFYPILSSTFEFGHCLLRESKHSTNTFFCQSGLPSLFAVGSNIVADFFSLAAARVNKKDFSQTTLVGFTNFGLQSSKIEDTI